MPDYTPTTEDIKGGYAYACDYEDGAKYEDSYAEVDRWVAEVKAEQDKVTTYRIIALLESIKPGCECNDCDKPAEEARTYLDHIIALIKGENNV